MRILASFLGVQTKFPYDKTPSCNKTLFKVNYLDLIVNIVKEKD